MIYAELLRFSVNLFYAELLHFSVNLLYAELLLFSVNLLYAELLLFSVNLLYAEYGNSHIASSDPNQFKYKLYAIVFNEGMKWQKSLEIQDKLEKLNESEIKEATRSVRTFGYNPGEGGIRLDEAGDATLNYINEQNSSKYLQGNIQAYTNYLSSLKDVTTSYINKFQKYLIYF